MPSNSVSVNFGPVLSITNSAFCTLLICTAILVLKMMCITLMTIFNRMRSKKFISSEDAAWMNGEVGSNETIDRTRRAYLNDLEGIPIFLFVSFGYLWTNAPIWLMNTLFIVFVVVRILHTLAYAVYPVRQPVRALLWAVGFIITGYMAAHVALYLMINGYQLSPNYLHVSTSSYP